MSEIVWEDPPKSKRLYERNLQWPKRLAPLVEQPGRWAMVRKTPASSVHSTVHRLRNGTLKTPPGQWEFVARLIDGHGYIYARYLNGEASA